MHQHMNHARYFSFLEQARLEFCEERLGLKIGSDYKTIPFIIASVHCDYKAPAYLNDQIAITVVPARVGTKSFQLDYELKDENTNEIIANAYTVLVMFDYEKMKSMPIPVAVRKKLS